MRLPMLLAGLAFVVLGGFGVGVGRAQIESPPVVESGLLSGKIVDDAGHPVVGAWIRLPELQRQTWTGDDGAYRIDGLPPGRTRVVVQRFGYEPAVQDVQIAGLASLDLELVSTPFAISPVLVTATRSPIAPMQSPLPSATLFGERLRRNQTVSLARAIEVLPGVRTLSTGEQVGKPVIRGQSGARVLVLDDGRRLEDYSWSDEDGPSIDARQVQRVEVVRGPASVLYGSDAVSGVVNAIPADLPEAVAGHVMHAALEGYAASNNREGGGALRLEGGSRSTGWRLHAIGRASGNMRTPTGELHNTGFGALNGEAAFGVRGKPGNVTLRYVRYGGEFKLLEKEGPPTGTGTQEEGPERKLADDRVQLGANYFVHGLRLEARGQWQRHNLIEVADDPGSAPGSGQESEQFNLLLNTGTLDLITHHQSEHLHGSIGVHGMAQSNDSRGPIALVPDAHITDGALFAFEQYDMGRFSLLAGAREDLRHLDADGNSQLRMPDESRDYDHFSADFGAVFRPRPPVAIAANIGKAWRAPTLFELFANGPHLGEARYEMGDANLTPEDGVVVDASVRWQSRRWRAEVAGFHNTMSDYIHVVPTNQFVDGLRVYQHAQTDARLYGGELRAEVEALSGLTFRGRVETVFGDDTQADEPLPLVPPVRGVVGGEYGWGAHRWMDSAKVGADVEMVGEQTRLSTFDTPTAAYALLHVEGGIVQHWSDHEVAIDLAVRNAFDASYADYLSRYKEFALNPGRNVMVRVSTGF